MTIIHDRDVDLPLHDGRRWAGYRARVVIDRCCWFDYNECYVDRGSTYRLVRDKV